MSRLVTTAAGTSTPLSHGRESNRPSSRPASAMSRADWRSISDCSHAVRGESSRPTRRSPERQLVRGATDSARPSAPASTSTAAGCLTPASAERCRCTPALGPRHGDRGRPAEQSLRPSSTRPPAPARRRASAAPPRRRRRNQPAGTAPGLAARDRARDGRSPAPDSRRRRARRRRRTSSDRRSPSSRAAASPPGRRRRSAPRPGTVTVRAGGTRSEDGRPGRSAHWRILMGGRGPASTPAARAPHAYHRRHGRR